MTDLINDGDAIEGEKVNGSCRNPPKSFGLKKVNGIRCTRWEFKFNVRAHITSELTGNLIFEQSAKTSAEYELICDKALAHSLSKSPNQHVAAASATHQATHWAFAARTGIRIVQPHQELMNAIRKRMLNDEQPPAMLQGSTKTKDMRG